MRSFGFILLAMLSAQAGAASISKCVDSQGRVTFTQNLNCPGGSSPAGSVRAHSPTISGSSAPVKMAETNRATSVAPQGKELTVIGQPQKRTLPVDGGAEHETPVRASGGNRNAAQPCIRFVDKRVSSTRRNKDGSTSTKVEIVKVPAPC